MPLKASAQKSYIILSKLNLPLFALANLNAKMLRLLRITTVTNLAFRIGRIKGVQQFIFSVI
jgi:hypothetical protein